MSKILVTKPFQAPYDEISTEIQRAWDTEWLTNNGPILRQLEDGIKEYLGTRDCAVVSNGTIAIQVALRALKVDGEVITTPFSYVATTSSLAWEGCTPVFVDIDPRSFNLDPSKIEAAITEKTTAILATHVFGVPCDVNAIDKVAKKHGLKVIYDAAHCFGTTIGGSSIMNYGDIATLSLHATKLFHSVEGGAIFVNDTIAQKVDSIAGEVSPLRFEVDRLRNFGHHGPEVFSCVGINAKNSELHAAVGLVNLRYADKIIADRKRQHQCYNDLLQSLPLQYPEVPENVEWNHSYYPVVFTSEAEALAVKDGLESLGIYARRYFHPALNTLNYIDFPGVTPVADQISSSILCLPLYYGLEEDKIMRVATELIRICTDYRS